MGRNNYSYNGMLSVIARKPIFRYKSRQKTSQEVVDELRGESDNRKVDSITNLVSRIFSVPEYYLKRQITGPRLTLNGNPIISLQRFSSYNDLGVSSNDVDGSVTTDQSTVDILTPGTYYVTYSARDLLGYLSTIQRTVVIEDTQNTIYSITAAGGIFLINNAANPPITLKRGSTYHFTYSGTTDHPFALRETDDTSYTNGLNTPVNPHTFTVPNDAPSTLKYYCTSHGNGMGNIINIVDGGEQEQEQESGSPIVLSLLIVGSYYRLDGTDIYTQGTLTVPDHTNKKIISRGTDYEIDISGSAFTNKQMRLSTSSQYHISHAAAVANIYSTNVTYVDNDKITISPNNLTPNYLYLFDNLAINLFYIGNIARKNIYLTQGVTYTFFNNDYASHPLGFSSGSDGSGTVYSTGLTGLGSSPINWDTSSYSPGTSYYYCGNHNGMGGEVYIQSPTWTVTIVSTSYGNKYAINNTQQLELNLTRGTTYTFNISDGTTHPFNISTQPDGGGTVYGASEGVSGLGTNTITWTVASNAPTTLYYFCNQHSGMGGIINLQDSTFSLTVNLNGPIDGPIEVNS
jgi:plastocyanin